jgi:surfactin synthase thioesterase subunit
MIYARWRRLLPSWLEVRPLELPGRGRRIGEPPMTDLPALAARLAGELVRDGVRDAAMGVDAPYALFGHSLGGLVAFEMAHELRRLGAPAPRMLFASAAAAPSRRDDGRWAEPLDDAGLIAEMRRLSGTPEEVFSERDLLDMALPVLRADFLMVGRYEHRRRPPLDCPIAAFGGRHDDIAQEALLAWKEETTGSFSLTMFEGDHFFIRGCEGRLLDHLLDRLGAAAAAPAGA